MSRLNVKGRLGDATPEKPSILKEMRVILVLLCCQYLMTHYTKFHVTWPLLIFKTEKRPAMLV